MMQETDLQFLEDSFKTLNKCIPSPLQKYLSFTVFNQYILYNVVSENIFDDLFLLCKFVS